MASEAPEAKKCSICGIDVSTKPRSKDAKGRYVCAECVTKAKETKHIQQNPPKPVAKESAKPSEDEADNSFLLYIGGKAQALEGGKACPNCDMVMNQRDQVCLSCGYNMKEGRVVRTKIEKEKPPKP